MSLLTSRCCNHDREGRPVKAADTLGYYRFCRNVVFGTYKNTNLFARIGSLNS